MSDPLHDPPTSPERDALNLAYYYLNRIEYRSGLSYENELALSQARAAIQRGLRGENPLPPIPHPLIAQLHEYADQLEALPVNIEAASTMRAVVAKLRLLTGELL